MTVVFTNGCFDILHVGHVRLLAFARGLGDRLVVGLNADESVRRLKGGDRPVHPVEWRREVLLAIRYVDEVEIFDTEADLEALIRSYKPVLVKGSDYRDSPITGSRWATRIDFLPFVPGASTTKVIYEL